MCVHDACDVCCNHDDVRIKISLSQSLDVQQLNCSTDLSSSGGGGVGGSSSAAVAAAAAVAVPRGDWRMSGHRAQSAW